MSNSVDTVQLAVIANRIDTVVREMENTLLRTGRSAVLNMARDFSCSIITGDNRMLSSAEGLPVHVFGSDALGRAMCERHDDISEGDAFLNNDPYLGNTHPADHTILVPVFYEGVHMFTCAAKAHQADAGNAAPTTYMPFAEDIYAEGGLIFPAIRVQKNFENVEDVIETCRRRIRVPEQWYGDYLAMVGSARIGERRLKELCEAYGPEAIRAFIEEWFDYSERSMEHAIRQMPAGTISGSSWHDPLIPILPQGVEVKVTVRVDPKAGMVELDLRDNIDCVDAGINESETCATNNVLTGFFNSIHADIPKNDGSFRRIRVLLRENCVAGIPRFPHSCSTATTNIGERIVVATQRAIANAWDGFGLAEGACGVGAGYAVVAGRDSRRGEAYINQKFLGSQGGPGGPEHDGWVTYGNAVSNGLMFRDSVEIDELKYPIRIGEVRLRQDSEGAGRRRGAPGFVVSYGPTTDRMSAAFVTAGFEHPPRGARGGGDGAKSIPYRVAVDGSRSLVEPVAQIFLEAGELLGHELSGGGGYGDPLEREPERVRADVLQGVISIERAETVYGVRFSSAEIGESLEIDWPATEKLRGPGKSSSDGRVAPGGLKAGLQ